MSDKKQATSDKRMVSCPFCGCGDYHVKLRKQGNKGYRVICGKCGASGPYSPIREWHDSKLIAQNIAISGWNTRKPVDAVLEHLEEEKQNALKLWDNNSRYMGYEHSIKIVKENLT